MDKGLVRWDSGGRVRGCVGEDRRNRTRREIAGCISGLRRECT